MATLKFYWYYEITANGKTDADGSLTSATEITITNPQIYDRTFRVADSTLVQIYDITCLADFDFMVITSDQDAEIQLLCNEGDTDEIGVVCKLRADIPFVLGYDDSRFGTVANIDTWESNWTADVIDRIECYQTSGEVANVKVFAVT